MALGRGISQPGAPGLGVVLERNLPKPGEALILASRQQSERQKIDLERQKQQRDLAFKAIEINNERARTTRNNGDKLSFYREQASRMVGDGLAETSKKIASGELSEAAFNTEFIENANGYIARASKVEGDYFSAVDILEKDRDSDHPIYNYKEGLLELDKRMRDESGELRDPFDVKSEDIYGVLTSKNLINENGLVENFLDKSAEQTVAEISSFSKGGVTGALTNEIKSKLPVVTEGGRIKLDSNGRPIPVISPYTVSAWDSVGDVYKEYLDDKVLEMGEVTREEALGEILKGRVGASEDARVTQESKGLRIPRESQLQASAQADFLMSTPLKDIADKRKFTVTEEGGVLTVTPTLEVSSGGIKFVTDMPEELAKGIKVTVDKNKNPEAYYRLKNSVYVESERGKGVSASDIATTPMMMQELRRLGAFTGSTGELDEL